jgi:competence protein ComFC
MSLASGRPNAILQRWGGLLLDLIFPARCVNCKRVNHVFCPPCLATVQRITSPTCPRCGHPLRSARAACPECRAHPPTITRIQSAYWHEGALREAIHALKYNRRRDVALPLAQLLGDLISSSSVSFDLVTSVPLHPVREQERGYNQAELLAQHVAQARQLPYQRLLQRTRATADQIGLDGPARRDNVANAFSANASQCADKTVLIIDDVCTTGATLNACATALFQAEARAVCGLTIARPHPSF